MGGVTELFLIMLVIATAAFAPLGYLFTNIPRKMVNRLEKQSRMG